MYRSSRRCRRAACVLLGSRPPRRPPRSSALERGRALRPRAAPPRDDEPRRRTRRAARASASRWRPSSAPSAPPSACVARRLRRTRRAPARAPDAAGRAATRAPRGRRAARAVAAFVRSRCCSPRTCSSPTRVLDDDEAAALRRALDARRRRRLRHRDDPARPDAAAPGAASRRAPPTALAVAAALGVGRRRPVALVPGRSSPRAFGEEYADRRPPRRPVPAGDGAARRRARPGRARLRAERARPARGRAAARAIALHVALRVGDRRRRRRGRPRRRCSSHRRCSSAPAPRRRHRAADACAVPRSLPSLGAAADAHARAIRRPCLVAVGARACACWRRRGLWVDEAISVSQAQLPFGEMLADMRDDRRPPAAAPRHALGHGARLRHVASSPSALPSLIAGVALVPAAVLGRPRRSTTAAPGWIAAVLADDRPVLRLVLAGSPHVLALHAVRGARAARRPGARRPPRPAASTGRCTRVSTALLIWTQYFGIVPIVVQQVGVRLGDLAARRRAAVARARQRLAAVALVAIGVLVAPVVADRCTTSSPPTATAASGFIRASQAGAGSSTIGGTISIYVGRRQPDLGVPRLPRRRRRWSQIAALWPLLMLARARDARPRAARGREPAAASRSSSCPMAALFALGSLKPYLFELRYFCGAVPAMLLLVARAVDRRRPRAGRRRVAAAVVPRRAHGPRASSTSSSTAPTPALYDFQGAFARDRARAPSRATSSLYEPSYLARGRRLLRRRPDAPGRSARRRARRRAAAVFVLDRAVLNAKDTPAPRLGRRRRAELDRERRHRRTFDRPNVRSGSLPMTDVTTDPRLRPTAAGAADVARRRPAALGGMRGCSPSLQHRSALVLLLRGCCSRSASATRCCSALLIAAELFNVVQALGFWWTCLGRRARRRSRSAPSAPPPPRRRRLHPDLQRAGRRRRADRSPPPSRMRGARVARRAARRRRPRRDGARSPHRHGVRYVRRRRHDGRQGRQHQPRAAPHRRPVRARARLRPRAVPATSSSDAPEFADEARGVRADAAVLRQRTARTGSPARRGASRRCSSGRSRGARTPTARCSAAAPTSSSAATRSTTVGGFPQDSLTEDFALSIDLHERGWRVGVRARGAGAAGSAPRTWPSYVSQQHRWARGCLGAIPACCGARLPLRKKLQYLLSASYFLSGWTVLVYLALP